MCGFDQYDGIRQPVTTPAAATAEILQTLNPKFSNRCRCGTSSLPTSWATCRRCCMPTAAQSLWPRGNASSRTPAPSTSACWSGSSKTQRVIESRTRAGASTPVFGIFFSSRCVFGRVPWMAPFPLDGHPRHETTQLKLCHVRQSWVMGTHQSPLIAFINDQRIQKIASGSMHGGM